MATVKNEISIQDTQLSNEIVRSLRSNTLVQEAVSLNPYHFTLVLNLTHQATEVFVKSLLLGSQLRVSYDPSNPEEYPSVFIYASDSNIGKAKLALEVAFKQVSNYLEYRELEKDYASGYLPRHLSRWLMEESSR